MAWITSNLSPGNPPDAHHRPKRPFGDRGMSASRQITTTGAVVVTIHGELDMATGDEAFRYVKDVIDRHRMAVTVDVAGVAFCDARGLGALVRMNNYARQERCPLWLASPQPHLARIMCITRLGMSLQPP